MTRVASARASAALFAAFALGGCLLVTPLDEFKPGSGSAGGAGKPSSGGAPGGGEKGQSGAADTAGAGGTGSGGTPAEGGAPGGGAAGGDGGEPSGGAPPTGCRSNAECIELGATGAPYRCSEAGECIALKTGVCPLVYDSDGAKHDHPIYVGAFSHLPPALPDTSASVFPLRLARDEISGDAYGGLVMPDGTRRPLVLVVCDNTPDVVDEGAAHLVEDVGVSSILATLLPGDLRRVFERHEERDVFYLSPVGATSAVATLDDEDRVWTMLGQPRDLVPAYRDLVEDLVEPYLRSVRGIGERPIRVALLRGSDAFGAELSAFVAAALRFNGEPLADNDADGNYLGLTFDGELETQDAVDQLLDFVPDLVISTAGPEVTRAETGVVLLLETMWDGFVTAPRPFYVLSPFNAGNLTPITELLETELAGVDSDPMRRFVGISAAGAEDPRLQNAFAVNLTDQFENADTDTGNYYDAFYFLAYALYGARVDEPRGVDIARGMRRLLEGNRLNVGLADISNVFETLAAPDESIALEGTLGPPAFDLETGIRIDPGGVYCFTTTGNRVFVEPDALRYSIASESFAGNFPCFSDFFP
jgi:hypothetical protein